MFPRSVPKVLESLKLTRQALHQSNVSAEVTGDAGPREGTWEQTPASAAEAAGSGDGLRLCPARLAGGGTCGLAEGRRGCRGGILSAKPVLAAGGSCRN